MLLDSFLMFGLLGGITSIPYLWQIADKMRVTQAVKNWIAENKSGVDGSIRKFFEYGLFGLAGVDLSSSLGVQFPSNFALVGAYKELQRAYNNADIDGISRIFEVFTPRAIEDLIKTLRYIDKGVRNRYGTPLFKLQKGKQIPITYDTLDSLIKILGGYPSHISRDLFVYYTAKALVGYWDRKVKVVRIKMREAYNKHDWKTYREYYKQYLNILRQAKSFGIHYGTKGGIPSKYKIKMPTVKIKGLKIPKSNLPFRQITQMPKNVERVERRWGY